MGLALTLKKEKTDSLYARLALCIAMESYIDSQNAFGVILRKKNMLDIARVLALLTTVDKTREGEKIEFHLEDALTLVTSFDITHKSLTSPDSHRFVHSHANDAEKREALKKEIIHFCKKTTNELSEQPVFRNEVEQLKKSLESFVYE